MPYPDGLTLVTVRCQLDGPARIRFESRYPMQGPTDNAVVRPFQDTEETDDDHLATFELPANNDPGWTPVDAPYVVTVSYDGGSFRGTVLLDYETTEAEFADVFQPDGAAEPGVTYATLAQLQAVADASATLPIDIDDVTGLQTELDTIPTLPIAISDVNDLQTQLDGKLAVPIEPYLTAADVDHLQSQESAQEADALVVHLAGAETVTGLKDLTAGLKVGDRFQVSATGGMDWGPAGGPNDTNFYRAGPGILRTDYSVQVGGHTLDGATGVAALGAKNGATNVRIVGYLDIATAPTSGTWAVGDVVLTQIGQFRCTVAGTPGTWVPMWREQVVDKGYAAWNGDPGQSVQAGTIIPTGGLSFIFRLRALKPLISKVQMHCSTTASGITNAWCTFHDDNGLILNANAKSDANQNTAFNSGGMKNFTFIAPQVVTPGAFYRARVWFTTGGTLPTISRMCNSNTAIINPDITGTAASTAYGWASADGGLTDLVSAPDQIGNLTGANTAWWMGAK